MHDLLQLQSMLCCILANLEPDPGCERVQVAAGDRVARPVVPRVVLTRSGGNPGSRPMVVDPAALGGVRASHKFTTIGALLFLVLSCDGSLQCTASHQQLPGP